MTLIMFTADIVHEVQYTSIIFVNLKEKLHHWKKLLQLT